MTCDNQREKHFLGIHFYTTKSRSVSSGDGRHRHSVITMVFDIGLLA